eukprot:5641833-Amphidinium_carterae.2
MNQNSTGMDFKGLMPLLCFPVATDEAQTGSSPKGVAVPKSLRSARGTPRCKQHISYPCPTSARRNWSLRVRRNMIYQKH